MNKKKNLFIAIILCFGVIFFTHNVFVVYADEDDVEQLNDEYNDLGEKIEKTQDILLLKQKEQEIINAQITNIANENKKVEQDIEETKQEIEELESDIDRTQKEIDQKEEHIALQKKILENFVREKYQNYSPDTIYFTTLNIANSNQQNHKDSLAYTTTSISDFVEKIHNEQEELKKDQINLEKKADRIEDAKYELEQRSAHLEDSQNYKRVLASEVAAEEDKYQEKLSDLVKEQLEIQQEISSLSSDKIGTFSMKDLPDTDDFSFDEPVNKPFVRTQGYGKTTFSHNYATGTHNGIDFVAQGSQNIIAAADGKVKATGDMGRYGYGKWAAVDHDNGLITLYGHMSSVKVSRGDKLDQGDKIGVMGSTGFSTGAHVHFSAFVETTFDVIESSSVSGVYIPTGATINPDLYL